MLNPKHREQGAWSWPKLKFLPSFRDPWGLGAMKKGGGERCSPEGFVRKMFTYGGFEISRIGEKRGNGILVLCEQFNPIIFFYFLSPPFPFSLPQQKGANLTPPRTLVCNQNSKLLRKILF